VRLVNSVLREIALPAVLVVTPLVIVLILAVRSHKAKGGRRDEGEV
jgi:hypothetical protein